LIKHENNLHIIMKYYLTIYKLHLLFQFHLYKKLLNLKI
jgi:hypothetical protein